MNCAEWAHVKQKVLLQVGSSKCAVPTRTRARQTSRLALRNAARRWPSVFHRFPLNLQPFTVLVCVTDLPEELREVLVLALDLEEDEEERVVQRLGALLAARIPHTPGPRLTRHPPVDRKTNSLIGSEQHRKRDNAEHGRHPDAVHGHRRSASDPYVHSLSLQRYTS